MDIGSREWQNFIVDGAQQRGITIDERISAAFAVHAAELIHWNRKINLTAITDPRDIAIKHFLDSLAPAQFIPERARLLDIGSGAGFPGVPLKIFNPSLSVLLIDGTRKKVNFLKHMIRSLGLDRIRASHVRAENLGHHPELATAFDVIISRALSDLTSFVNYALPLLAKQGTIIGMKGEVSKVKLDRLQTEILGDRFLLEVENYNLTAADSQRSMIIIKHLD
ncbi:MAG: 16S rRNA (guanine(527)-N(7))-methyltransferase RsmG [Desulfobacterales bacterium]|jgi:16S rRNA (guanine527-N7)-methyltransferase